MTERIKLSEKSFDIEECGMGDNTFAVHINERFALKDAQNLKAQILEDQKIVDGIKQFYKEYKESEDAGFNRDDRSYIFLQNLIHQTLGKDIKELE